MGDEQEPNFSIVTLLGQGAFGTVVLIEDNNNPENKFAMKIMNLLNMGPDELDLLVQEIGLLATLDHKHVLKYISCFRQGLQMCIITEFCPNGDLADYIAARRGQKLEEDRLIEWFRQIVSAVEYLHQNNVIHRDIKSQNVFLNGDMDCILGDLGVARKVDENIGYAQTRVGTPAYTSPEMFFGIPYNSKTDVWSLAVMIYELAALEKPFNQMFLPLLIHQVTMGEKPAMPVGYCKDFTELLSSMMEKFPNDRPTSTIILQHQLFKRQLRPAPLESFRTEPIQREPVKDKNIAQFVRVFVKMRRLAYRARQRVKEKKADQTPAEDPKPQTSGGAQPEAQMPEVKTKTMTLKEMGEIDKQNNNLTHGRTTYLQGQYDHFKEYCLKAIDNDAILLKDASLALNKLGTSEDIQRKLIAVLGEEKFQKCGVQILYYKNYGHNLRNK